MKSFKKAWLLCLCLLLASSFCMAHGNNGTINSPIIIPPKHGKHSKPNAPSREIVVCHFLENGLEFELPQSIYSMTVSVINTEYVLWTGLVTKDYPVAEISLPSGEWTINCVAEDGRIFSGNLSIP